VLGPRCSSTGTHPGDATRARDLIAAGCAEVETRGMAREILRFERLTVQMESGASG
jgi:hypothetical protein